MMTSIRRFQDQLIAKAKDTYSSNPISARTVEAFYAVPRHEFVSRYRPFRGDHWIDVSAANLEEHLSTLYADHPLILHGSDEEFESKAGSAAVSTISQPTFVLRMIDLLQLESGMKVYELGAGSDWNAALLGHCVGPSGKVVSTEIIPNLVKSAQASLARLKLGNVSVLSVDGGAGYQPDAPYDRAVFTAGSYDLPQAFYDQIKLGGLLLFVLKNKGGTDTLLLMRKKADHFESIFSMNCGFVALTGKFHIQSLEPVSLSAYLDRFGIAPSPIEKTPFWWGGTDEDQFIWKTAGLRSFFSVSDPQYVSIEIGKGKFTFGFHDIEKKSLVVASHDGLISYGSPRAKEDFISKAKNWVTLGMPALANLKLKAFPISVPVHSGANQWLVKRTESRFLWSLPEMEKA